MTTTDPIQIEIARIQAMGDRIEALCDRLEARLDAQDAAHAETARTLLRLTEAMEAGPEPMGGERKTYADFEWDIRLHNQWAHGWSPVRNRLDLRRQEADGEYRFRCAHTHAPVTAAEIRAAVEGPKKLNPNTGKWDAPVLAAHEGNGFDDIDTREVRP